MDNRPRLSWWGRQSVTRRIFYIGLAALLILGLALGLGLGLGLGRGDEGGDESGGGGDEGGGGEVISVNGTDGKPLPPVSGSVWQPKVGSSWQIVLNKAIDLSSPPSPDVQVYDIDLFINSADTIKKLRSTGHRVVCYFSAGTYEDWRPDANQFDKSDLGKAMGDWPGEWWLDIRKESVLDMAKKRIDMASEKGCDAVDPDNVDGYENENGLGLKPEDSTRFVRAMAEYAASKSMATGLKNAAVIIPDVLNATQFSVNEQCAEYGDCADFLAFIKAGKPIFHIEYPKGVSRMSASSQTDFCVKGGDDVSASAMTLFSTVLKNMDLDGYVRYCNGNKTTTKVIKDNANDD